MSDRVILYVIIGAFLFAVGFGMFAGWHIKPDKQCPIIKDTTYVKGDTIFVPYPVTVIKWKEKQPAVIEKDGYSALFDTSFVSHKDTIGVKGKVNFYTSTKEFGIDMDIEHRDYENIRVDTIKVNYIDVKEVEVDNPLWIWTTVAGGILLILSIIFGG